MVIIGFGSNRGDKIQKIRQGLEYLQASGFRFSTISPIFLTPPWGIKEQETFLNGVAAGSFDGSAQELLHLIQKAEELAGRKRVVKWGPRELDIDILEFNESHIDTLELSIPHPWYTQRGFVLIPFKAILPNYTPTGTHKSITNLVSNLSSDEKEGIEYFQEIGELIKE